MMEAAGLEQGGGDQESGAGGRERAVLSSMGAEE
jgi:hypothetical protein